MLKDNVVFFAECFRTFKTTGSFWPTSRKSAIALTEPLRRVHGARHILEVGPGTGSNTVVILEQMTSRDTLTICEINPRLMKQLKVRLSTDPNFLRHQNRVSFFTGPVQEMPEDKRYNAIVCAVPFNNFDVAITKDIFEKLERLSEDGALMSYYEYIVLRDLVKISPIKAKRQQAIAVDKYIDSTWTPHRVSKTSIIRNILPIYVYLIDMTAERKKVGKVIHLDYYRVPDMPHDATMSL